MSSEPTLTGQAPARTPEPGEGDGFAHDDLVGGRYRIERRLGSGGMGAVYQAEDHELGGYVALKTVLPEIAGDAGMLERLRRETQLARQITHPNVCRVFDLGRHAGGEAFLTMELLEGETLAHRLKREGRLPLAEILPIAAGVARGLAAAHAAGVVHRDLKGGNIMLVGDRPVLMDFGVARVSRPDTPLSAQSSVAGTPAYMAPEQAAGSAVGPSADVYAFGVVLHEMFTGGRPFEGGAGALPPRWSALIRRCLDPDPALRPTSRELVAEIERPPGARRRRYALAALAGAACAVAMFLFTRPPSKEAALAGRRAVAVLGFKDLGHGGDTAWIATALSEMLTSEIAAAETLRTVPGETVARARLDIGLPESNAYGGDTLARLRLVLGADMVVHGRYLAVGGKVRVDMLVQDAASGETIAALTEEGPEGDILGLIGRGGRRLRLALGVDESAQVLGALPDKPEVARLYAEGLARLRRFDGVGAREHLTAAVAADPRFALAHSALAETYTLLGFEQRAREEAEQASALAGNLGRADRLLVEARAHDAAGRYDQAADRYRTLWEFFPDNLEYGLSLAYAQSNAGRFADADATLAAMRAMPPPFGDDPRIDLVDADEARRIGDIPRRLASGVRAARGGAARGSRFTVAVARIEEAWASYTLGDTARAAAAFADAQILAGSVGARGVVGNALLGAGMIAFQEGRVELARRQLDSCLTIRREIGELRGKAEILQQLGWVLEQLGELDEAEKLQLEAQELAGRIGMTSLVAQSHYYLGWVAYWRGQYAVARREFQTAEERYAAIGNRWMSTLASHGVAELSFIAGDLAGATALFERGVTELSGMGIGYSGYSKHGKARMLAAQGRFDEARALHQEVRDSRRAQRHLRTVPESILELSSMEHDAGRVTEALALARESADGLAAVGSVLKEGFARAYLAALLAEAGDLPAAHAELLRSEATTGRCPRVRVAVAMAGAVVFAVESRDVEAATARLAAAADAAEKAGDRDLALRARLNLGRYQSKVHAAEARRTLDALASDARAAGWPQMAEMAQAAAR